MRIFADACVAALAAMGLYLIFICLVTPGVKSLGKGENLSLTVLLGAKNCADELESTVKTLLRLREGGFACFDIEIKDMGLDKEALERAKILTHNQGVHLVSPPKEN